MTPPAVRVRGATITHLASSLDVLPITVMRVMTAPWRDDPPDKSCSSSRTNSPPRPDTEEAAAPAIISNENSSTQIGRDGVQGRGAGRLLPDAEGEIGNWEGN